MKMIKKTRHKFMFITIVAIFLVLSTILGILNFGVYLYVYFSGKENIELIRAQKGFLFSQQAIEDYFSGGYNDYLADVMSPEGKISYMYVNYNAKSEFPFITTNMSDTYSPDEINYLAKKLMQSGSERGIYKDLMYQVTNADYETTVVIIDISNDLSLIANMFKMSIIVVFLSLIFVYLFTYYFSKWAIKPVQTAFENQQRFISDASHELKTPLTVISANADVLESEIGSNKWLDNIKNQSVLMNELVYDLLDLAKLDETREDMVMAEFNLSDTIMSKALEFECTAFESGKTFEQNIGDDIMYTGNEEQIKHLASILIDNAIKHSNENGTVRVTLTTNGNKRIFQVYNTGNTISDEEKLHIFDRFYRSDKSRARATGGYGLGLSIAKSIVDVHSGNIVVDGEEGRWISFTCIL